MIGDTTLRIWQSHQQRFLKMVRAITVEDLMLQTPSGHTIGHMIRHGAEVEYMFAEWYFARSIPADVQEAMTKAKEAGKDEVVDTNTDQLVQLITASSDHLVSAMSQLPEDKWLEVVEAKYSAMTPLDAVSALMYHTGIHAGQISLIQKQAKS